MRAGSTIATAAVAAAITMAASRVQGQRPPAVRPVGRLERVSSDSLASVAGVIAMPGGRVLVNDRIGRRLLMFDSTLAHPVVVADTTSATANAYGTRPAALIRYRGDSALLIDQTSLSMFVVGPTGGIGRVMAVPRPEDVQAIGAKAGFDAQGRLIYANALGSLPGVMMLGRGDKVSELNARPGFRGNVHIDSAFIVRIDPATRAVDSIAAIRIPKVDRKLVTDAAGLLTSIENVPDPLPVLDDWAVMHDGSVAVLRGRDFHIDWLDPAGHWSSSPKMPFDWQRVDDAHKQTLIDSTVNAWQATYDGIMKPAAGRSAGRGGAGGGGGGRGGSGPPGGGGGGGGSSSELAPLLSIAPPLNSVTDYMPPLFARLSVFVEDGDGNLWIRTTTIVDGQPVYDVANRRGELIDRVQLPAFRTVAGFGPGVVYMAVVGGGGIVRLERARIK